jgi:hypothetical protein
MIIFTMADNERWHCRDEDYMELIARHQRTYCDECDQNTIFYWFTGIISGLELIS